MARSAAVGARVTRGCRVEVAESGARISWPVFFPGRSRSPLPALTLPDEERCITARTSDNRCKRRRLPNMTVCRHHYDSRRWYRANAQAAKAARKAAGAAELEEKARKEKAGKEKKMKLTLFAERLESVQPVKQSGPGKMPGRGGGGRSGRAPSGLSTSNTEDTAVPEGGAGAGHADVAAGPAIPRHGVVAVAAAIGSGSDVESTQ